MQINEDPGESTQGAIPLMVAAELQDHLMTVTNDLERLQRLIDDAYEVLIEGFQGAADQLGVAIESGSGDTPSLQNTLQTLYKAVTALQFQDMASQLIIHTNKRLRNCADQIARDAMGDDPDGMAVVEEEPLKPNPVTQDEMDAGSIELF
jgi:molybdopterin-guanine dinucleotide biosynthesis protein